MRISRCLAGTAAVVVLGMLVACGGGGGGGGGGSSDTPLQYSGNTNAAAITTSNASTLAANVIGGGDIAAATAAISGGNEAQSGQGLIDFGRRLARTVRANAKPRSDARPTAVLIDQTAPCANGGTARTFGDVSQFGTGTVTVTYTNCNEGGDALSGTATMRIDAFDLFDFIPTDFTLSFGRLALRGASNVDIGGSIRIVTNLGANTETITENVVALYIGTGRMTRSENLVFIDVYDDVLFPSNYVESISGRVFDSVHGFVDVITNAGFVFSTLVQPFPDSGQLLLSGAANARIRLTAVSTTVSALALDLDNNGVFETQARLNWNDLTGPAAGNLADSDGDGMHDSWESAFGLNPNANDSSGDPDSDGSNNLAEYNAGTRPNVADATIPPAPNPGPLPPGTVTGLLVTVVHNSDIVYDSVTQRIYAAVRTDPGSVVPIDPATGAIGTAILVGKNPVKLAISDNGQYLYVGFEAAAGGQNDVQRINLATQTVDLTIPLGNSQFAEDIHVLPGSPGSIAVSLRNSGFSPRHEGVAIYDGATRRGQVTPGHTGSNVIEFSASAGTLYGYNNETTEFGFRRMAVTASGVTVTDVHDSFNPAGALIQGFNVDMRFGGGFIFSTTGRMIDPIARTVVRTFALPGTFANLVEVEPSLNRVFYQTSNTIRAFDIGSATEVGNASVPSMTGTPRSLIRWGAKGLAFRTDTGQIFMVESTSWIP